MTPDNLPGRGINNLLRLTPRAFGDIIDRILNNDETAKRAQPVAQKIKEGGELSSPEIEEFYGEILHGGKIILGNPLCISVILYPRLSLVRALRNIGINPNHYPIEKLAPLSEIELLVFNAARILALKIRDEGIRSVTPGEVDLFFSPSYHEINHGGPWAKPFDNPRRPNDYLEKALTELGEDPHNIFIYAIPV